jgi:hypothetical protein
VKQGEFSRAKTNKTTNKFRDQFYVIWQKNPVKFLKTKAV